MSIQYVECNKKPYFTKTQAKKSARTEKLRLLKPMYTYECPICGFFHLSSHKKPRETYRIGNMVWKQ